MKSRLPEWRIPEDIEARVNADEDLMWSSEEWDPILLTVMGGTSYDGRSIPLAWQLEFEPDDRRLAKANEKLVALNVEPDGDGWSRVVQSVVEKYHPEFAAEFHTDAEQATCVVWVESEVACRQVAQVIWSLIHED